MEKLNEVFLLQIWIGRVSCLESQPQVMQWTMKIQLLQVTFFGLEWYSVKG